MKRPKHTSSSRSKYSKIRQMSVNFFFWLTVRIREIVACTYVSTRNRPRYHCSNDSLTLHHVCLRESALVLYSCRMLTEATGFDCWLFRAVVSNSREPVAWAMGNWVKLKVHRFGDRSMQSARQIFWKIQTRSGRNGNKSGREGNKRKRGGKTQLESKLCVVESQITLLIVWSLKLHFARNARTLGRGSHLPREVTFGNF